MFTFQLTQQTILIALLIFAVRHDPFDPDYEEQQDLGLASGIF